MAAIINQVPEVPTYVSNSLKQLVVPFAPGKFPLENEDLSNLQESSLFIIREIFGSAGTHFVINGAAVTAQNATASTCTVSAGYVYLNGNIRFFPGYTGAYPFFIVNDADVKTKKTFSDGNIKDAYVQRFAKAVTSPGTGQAIRCNPVAEYRYRDMMIAAPTAAISTLDASVTALQNEVRVPVGGIIMWGDTVIPSGWALCDGQNGRPDLRGKFIVGYDSGSVDYSTVGATGGAAAVSLTAAQNGPHTHTYIDTYHTETNDTDAGSNARPYQTQNQAKVTGSSGLGAPHENRPPFYTLCYIIRVV